jgi:thiosulfate dehydrogenase [quinone] large subunit
MSRASHVVQDPPLAKALFDHPLAGWLWVLPRIWLGWQWVQASEHKISDPAWVQTGAALKGFWAGAVAIPAAGKPAISFVWYRAFLEMLLNAHAYTWFAKVVAYGELLIGVALIVGAFTGIAAFLGGFMNWNFMMAGSASVNPVFFVISVGLILAWKVSGYIGADYLLLPWVGTPWGRTRGAKAQKASARPAHAPGD